MSQRFPEFSLDPATEEDLMVKARVGLNALVQLAHSRSKAAGWWHEKDGTYIPDQHYYPYVVGTKIALVHSETSEGLEGIRKNKTDDHLPHRRSFDVEAADAFIRYADLLGVEGVEDFGGILLEKMQYNAVRPDHKAEARAAEGGKTF